MYQIKTLQEKKPTGYADGSVCISLDLVVNRWLYEHQDIEIVNIQFFQSGERYSSNTAVILYIPSAEQTEDIIKHQKYVDERRAATPYGYNSRGYRVNPDYIY